MNGATAVPLVSTISPPNMAMTMNTGSSQYFLRSSKNAANSRRKEIIAHSEQNQMLSPVNRVAGYRRVRIRRSMLGSRPHRGRKDDQRQRENHPEPKCEAVWFLCHLFPSWPRIERPGR